MIIKPKFAANVSKKKSLQTVLGFAQKSYIGFTTEHTARILTVISILVYRNLVDDSYRNGEKGHAK